MITTFLLLRPLSAPRPQVTSTELPAGNAFNVALRTMASRDGFESQWFGWQHAPNTRTESNGTPERFIWVINWQDPSSAHALMSPGELRTTMGTLVEFFDAPSAVPSDLHIDGDSAVSKILTIQWDSGNALKLLNWTNRILVLQVRRPALDSPGTTQQHLDDASEPAWTAHGRLILPAAASDHVKPAVVIMRSVSAQHSDDVELYQDWQPFSEMLATDEVLKDSNSSIVVSLTRTRWCTKIREGLMDTIKAKRVD